MGLFKKSYIQRLTELSEHLGEVNLGDDDLILKFEKKVRDIEDFDLVFIKLIKALARSGHITERQKRALLNQLIVLLRRLESLKFEEKEELRQIKAEIDSFLRLEVTEERIGIEVTDYLYHGSGLSDIKQFQPDTIDFETSKTLDVGLYLTDSKRMAINYANYRYWDCMGNSDIKRRFGSRIKSKLLRFSSMSTS